MVGPCLAPNVACVQCGSKNGPKKRNFKQPVPVPAGHMHIRSHQYLETARSRKNTSTGLQHIHLRSVGRGLQGAISPVFPSSDGAEHPILCSPAVGLHVPRHHLIAAHRLRVLSSICSIRLVMLRGLAVSFYGCRFLAVNLFCFFSGMFYFMGV